MARTYEPIASQTLGSDTASVTFSDISGTWTDLVLAVSVRTTYSGQNEDNIRIRFNGDSGSNYSMTYLYGNGSSASSGRFSNQTYSDSYTVVGAPADGNTFSAGVFHFMSATNGNVFKTVLYSGGSIVNSVIRVVGLWRSTSAITSIAMSSQSGNNFKSGSTFSLYGIKAA